MSETNQLREHLYGVIMERMDQGEEQRREALADYITVMGGVQGKGAEQVAELVPPVLPKLYTKWVNMFLDRLFETVPLEQLTLVGDGTDENNAAIILAYIMFLESERMEKQVEEDLKEYGLNMSGKDEVGDVAAGYIRAQVAQAAKDAQEDKESKAEEYMERKGHA